MFLSDTSIKRPVFTAMVMIGLMTLGLLATRSIGVDLFPDVSFPIVTVTTIYPGAGPEEVEKQVTRKVEEAVSAVNGVDKVMSYSRDSVSQVVVQFKLEADVKTANSDVRDKVASVRGQLPTGVRDPIIQRFDPTSTAILTYTISSGRNAAETRRIAEDLDTHRKFVLAEHPNLTLTGLYNVLEKLRAGTAPESLPAAEQAIFRDGLVLILKELHDKLDAAVAAAYGWPLDLPEQEILSRLVALNRERAAEEAAGHIRWLRPDYQIPRFGTASDKLDLRGGKSAATPLAETAAKPACPSDEVAQAAAILAALFAATGPTTPDALAATFRGGRRNLPRIEATLAALTRLGHLSTHDGRTFALRRTA